MNKKIVVILLIGLVATIGLFGCTSEKVEKKESPTTGAVTQSTPSQETQNNTTAQTQETSDAPAQVELKVGETAKTDELEVTLKSFEKLESYEYCYSSYCNDQTPDNPDNIFLFAKVEIKNIDAEREFAFSTNFSLSDSEGNKIDPEFMNMREDKLDISKELYKGQKTSGSILFEIPTDATGLVLYYDFGNMFSGPSLAKWKLE